MRRPGERRMNGPQSRVGRCPRPVGVALIGPARPGSGADHGPTRTVLEAVVIPVSDADRGRADTVPAPTGAFGRLPCPVRRTPPLRSPGPGRGHRRVERARASGVASGRSAGAPHPGRGPERSPPAIAAAPADSRRFPRRCGPARARRDGRGPLRRAGPGHRHRSARPASARAPRRETLCSAGVRSANTSRTDSASSRRPTMSTRKPESDAGWRIGWPWRLVTRQELRSQSPTRPPRGRGDRHRSGPR